jgi:beta-galactosidase GanA
MLYSFANAQGLPSIVKKENGSYTFMLDGKPFIVLGAQLWNSSNWPYILNSTWPQLKSLHCNTLEAPVYWQQIAPAPGHYRFNEVDSLITGARKAGLRLILLWFGAYKNGSSQYAPEWVLTQPDKYTRVRNAGGGELQALSAITPANLEADQQAFTALMRHVKQVDGQQHTVIMVQVQNESGVLGTDRDYTAAADKLFKGPVPDTLLQALDKKAGNWQEVFGADAAEAFSAWCIARYVNQMAQAGQAVYDLPMYTNAWLKENGFQRPGEYPSGGPVSTMITVWKAAAPALQLLAPDIYHANDQVFLDICSKYSRPDNPLLVPEMGKGPDFARHQFHALGNFNAIGVAPYGIDPFGTNPYDERDKEKLDAKFSHIADNYRLLEGVLDKIAELQGSGRLRAAVEAYGLREQLLTIGDYEILFSYGFSGNRPGKPLTGRVLVGQLGPDEYLLAGFDARFQFRPRYGSGYATAEFISVEEGYYANGEWVRKRTWNGDEVYHSTLTPEGVILRIKLRKTGMPQGKTF